MTNVERDTCAADYLPEDSFYNNSLARLVEYVPSLAKRIDMIRQKGPSAHGFVLTGGGARIQTRGEATMQN